MIIEETRAKLPVPDPCGTSENSANELERRSLLSSKDGSVICEELVVCELADDETREMRDQETETTRAGNTEIKMREMINMEIKDKEMGSPEVEAAEVDTIEEQTSTVNRSDIEIRDEETKEETRRLEKANINEKTESKGIIRIKSNLNSTISTDIGNEEHQEENLQQQTREEENTSEDEFVPNSVESNQVLPSSTSGKIQEISNKVVQFI